VVVAAFLLIHLGLTTKRVQEVGLLVTVGLFGFAVDTLQPSAGLYAFAHASVPWLCPPWMVALWMLFASTLHGSMAWLAGRYRLAAALAALCGPVSYVAGARLGAIELSSYPLVSVAGIGTVWALVVPALLVIRDALCTPTAGVQLRSAGVF